MRVAVIDLKENFKKGEEKKKNRIMRLAKASASVPDTDGTLRSSEGSIFCW